MLEKKDRKGLLLAASPLDARDGSVATTVHVEIDAHDHRQEWK